MNIKYKEGGEYSFKLNGKQTDAMSPIVSYDQIELWSRQRNPTVTYLVRRDGGQLSGEIGKGEGVFIVPGLMIEAYNTGSA